MGVQYFFLEMDAIVFKRDRQAPQNQLQFAALLLFLFYEFCL